MPTPRPRSTEYRIRPATLADLDTLAWQRRAMFEATGLLAAPAGAALEDAERRYLRRAMPAGTFVAWLVECGGAIVAGGGLQLRTLQPRPGFVAGEPEGLIVSMWTDPAHRRRGLASQVLDAIVAWSRRHGVRRLTLHASEAGRPLYERYGFRATNEMRLELPPLPADPPDGQTGGTGVGEGQD
jgi:GNAT superfamily N-acetyltransferase